MDHKIVKTTDGSNMRTWLFMPVTSGSREFSIISERLSYALSPKLLLYKNGWGGTSKDRLPCPVGTHYGMPRLCASLTEAQWSAIVDKSYLSNSSGIVPLYRDYLEKEQIKMGYYIASNSGESLLHSIDFEPEATVAIEVIEPALMGNYKESKDWTKTAAHDIYMNGFREPDNMNYVEQCDLIAKIIKQHQPKDTNETTNIHYSF